MPTIPSHPALLQQPFPLWLSISSPAVWLTNPSAFSFTFNVYCEISHIVTWSIPSTPQLLCLLFPHPIRKPPSLIRHLCNFILAFWCFLISKGTQKIHYLSHTSLKAAGHDKVSGAARLSHCPLLTRHPQSFSAAWLSSHLACSPQLLLFFLKHFLLSPNFRLLPLPTRGRRLYLWIGRFLTYSALAFCWMCVASATASQTAAPLPLSSLI